MEDPKVGCTDGVLTIVLIPFSLAWSAWVYSTMWNWAAPELGLPLIGFGTMGVLASLHSAWTFRDTSTRKPEDGPLVVELLKSTLARGIAFAIGSAFYFWT